MTMNPSELERWAESRRTSTEIARAIMEQAADEIQAQRLWEDPTPVEMDDIEARAWELTDADTLYWGVETINRP